MLSRISPDRVRQGTMAIAAIRTAVGVAVLAAPRKTARLAGIEAQMTPVGSLMMAMFGIREVVLGLVAFRELRDGYPSTTLLRVNALCDLTDSVLVARAVRGGALPRLVPSAASAALAGVSQTVMARALDEAV